MPSLVLEVSLVRIPQYTHPKVPFKETKQWQSLPINKHHLQ